MSLRQITPLPLKVDRTVLSVLVSFEGTVLGDLSPPIFMILTHLGIWACYSINLLKYFCIHIVSNLNLPIYSSVQKNSVVSMAPYIVSKFSKALLHNLKRQFQTVFFKIFNSIEDSWLNNFILSYRLR